MATQRPSASPRGASPRNTPTTRMRQLAERLRDLRVRSGMTVESVAEHLLVSPSKVSRLETAQRRASQRDVRDLCQLYGVDSEERDRLMALAAQALETAWYQAADVDPVYRTFVGLEEAASEIDTFENLVVPGLLQTADYARALLRGLRPPGWLTDEYVEERVMVRSRRQALLERASPPAVRAVIDEAALRRPVGGAEVMAGQLDRLLQMCDQDAVSVQVVPAAVGTHPGLDGRFIVLRFTADQAVRDTVYVEGLLGELFLDRDSDVVRYKEIFDDLSRRVALDPDETERLLHEIHRFWTHA